MFDRIAIEFDKQLSNIIMKVVHYFIILDKLMDKLLSYR